MFSKKTEVLSMYAKNIWNGITEEKKKNIFDKDDKENKIVS